MPRGDGTGPLGAGAMTGRAAGYCAGYAQACAWRPAMGRGVLGRGMGRGFGVGGGRFGGMNAGWGMGRAVPLPLAADRVTLDPEQERARLKAQAKSFEDALNSIQQRLVEIDAETA